MTPSQIARCKPGQRVKFEPGEHDAGEYGEGTIIEKLDDLRVEIRWDDGESSTMVPLDSTRVFLIAGS